MEWDSVEWNVVGYQTVGGIYHDLTKEDHDFQEKDLYYADWVTIGVREDSEGADESDTYEEYTTFAGPWNEWDQFEADVQDYIDNEGGS